MITVEQQQKLYRRTLLVVVFAQMFGGAGLAAGITVGALLVKNMLGTDSVTGLPTALFTLGAAVTAYLVGRLTQQYGRRIGLAGGFFVGGLGALGVISAVALHQITLLFIALFIYGAGSATNLQTRYAGTDLATAKQRATAASTAMVFTTFGAVAGPNLVEWTGTWATALHLPALVGPFILAAAAYIIAGLGLFIFLRPDPYLIAQQIAKQQTTAVEKEGNSRLVVLGGTVMIVTQIVMVAIMTMTPIHMAHHGHALHDVGLVIGLHVGAMYLPSLITGVLVDKIGRTPMVIAAAVTLFLAGIVATVAPGSSLLWLVIALMLLGLGWNFGLISGTTLIIDGTTPETRARLQGKIDVSVSIAGASGGALSGFVVALSSYATLALVGAMLSFILLPVLVWSRKK